MRVAMFTEVCLPNVDGVVTRLTHTLEQLGEMGHEVLVFAPGNPPASHAGQPVSRVRSFSLRPIYPEIKVGLPTPSIADKMVHFRPDVVHAVNPVALAAFGVEVAVHRRLPLLASYHTDLADYLGKLGVGWARRPMVGWTRFLHNRAQVNLCTSPTMVRRARRRGVRHVELWPKAVDVQTFRPGRASAAMRARLTDGHPDARLLIYVGRLSREKDLADLVEPMRVLGAQGYRLAMVGSGPARAELERAFVGTPTVFTGYLAGSELAAAYASADAFVFPSTTETLGLVALESMASGVPVIAAAAGGLPDVIHDGTDGFLVTPHDGAGFADRARRLLGDDDAARRLRTLMAVAARAEAERHDWAAATRSLVERYREAIERHGIERARGGRSRRGPG
ncbi:MAG: glycosyltransferase family 1 protein [Propionibacterium sp.]|nr:glycosyltransferase family 1 protein [Propionibacterium sp.]